jgi:hypothetical protein
MKLIHKPTNTVVAAGDKIESFRKEIYTVCGWSEPTHPGSTGRIHVRKTVEMPTGTLRTVDNSFYPSVFDCEWR